MLNVNTHTFKMRWIAFAKRIANALSPKHSHAPAHTSYWHILHWRRIILLIHFLLAPVLSYLLLLPTQTSSRLIKLEHRDRLQNNNGFYKCTNVRGACRTFIGDDAKIAITTNLILKIYLKWEREHMFLYQIPNAIIHNVLATFIKFRFCWLIISLFVCMCSICAPKLIHTESVVNVNGNESRERKKRIEKAWIKSLQKHFTISTSLETIATNLFSYFMGIELGILFISCINFRILSHNRIEFMSLTARCGSSVHCDTGERRLVVVVCFGILTMNMNRMKSGRNSFCRGENSFHENNNVFRCSDAGLGHFRIVGNRCQTIEKHVHEWLR